MSLDDWALIKLGYSDGNQPVPSRLVSMVDLTGNTMPDDAILVIGDEFFSSQVDIHGEVDIPSLEKNALYEFNYLLVYKLPLKQFDDLDPDADTVLDYTPWIACTDTITIKNSNEWTPYYGAKVVGPDPNNAGDEGFPYHAYLDSETNQWKIGACTGSGYEKYYPEQSIGRENRPYHAPVISNAQPASFGSDVQRGDTLSFSVQITDSDNDAWVAFWSVDGQVRNSPSQTQLALPTGNLAGGSHSVLLIVEDATGDTAMHSWTFHLSGEGGPGETDGPILTTYPQETYLSVSPNDILGLSLTTVSGVSLTWMIDGEPIGHTESSYTFNADQYQDRIVTVSVTAAHETMTQQHNWTIDVGSGAAEEENDGPVILTDTGAALGSNGLLRWSGIPADSLPEGLTLHYRLQIATDTTFGPNALVCRAPRLNEQQCVLEDVANLQTLPVDQPLYWRVGMVAEYMGMTDSSDWSVPHGMFRFLGRNVAVNDPRVSRYPGAAYADIAPVGRGGNQVLVKYGVPRVSGSQPQQVKVLLYALNGRRSAPMFSTTAAPGYYSTTIDLNGLSAGIYIMRIRICDKLDKSSPLHPRFR
ncbi:MAG: hypothetical protein GF363_16145 [Chitinivibrionales bacterium]|nr:hypothetical protein [Chitinivibrionales bacterium]